MGSTSSPLKKNLINHTAMNRISLTSEVKFYRGSIPKVTSRALIAPAKIGILNKNSVFDSFCLAQAILYVESKEGELSVFEHSSLDNINFQTVF